MKTSAGPAKKKAAGSTAKKAAARVRIRKNMFSLDRMNQVTEHVRRHADDRRAARVISDDVIGQPVSV